MEYAIPRALVRDGWVQNDRERLYSLRKEKREVDSRGKNFKAIGVPGGYKGKISMQVFFLGGGGVVEAVTKVLVSLFTSLPVYSQHDFAIGAFTQEL